MRDLTSPLAESLFDGGDRKHKRKVRRAQRQHEKKTASKFGEARGMKTKTEEKGPVYVSKKQQAKSCSGSAKGGGYKECGRD